MGDSEGVGETAWKDEELPVTFAVLRYLLNDARTVSAALVVVRSSCERPHASPR